ncbi:hybrid sensor histidine kinase/response regulator transcription factor [Mangrovibacterium lignilyticum]|uniref:hybrid sensor histidine kinase/response regulator transcription factor n=1 Tax=Mangrovibacterium lignilyticum TaxID=2668052 RepID=UPI0013D346C2|nr:hybrid sensor histidine kinase/response regulator transcription factor [Mangrovibacterium lignilyticum]
MRRYLLTILLCFAGLAYAQERFTFGHLATEDGLANNSVRSMLQDKDGYLWFGTLNGLSRYDGQRFENFFYDPSDPNSISNNKVREIFQDGAGYIWTTTYDDITHRYDPRTEEFINFPSVFGKDFSDFTVHFTYESSPGVVWLYMAGHGCVRIVSSPDSPYYTWTWFNENNLLKTNSLNFMQRSINGGLWIGSESGLSYFENDQIDPNNKAAATHYFAEDQVSTTQLYEHRDTCWIGCKTGEFYELTSGKMKLIWKSNHSNSSFNQFCFIKESKGGFIYGGTRNGILQYNPKTGETKHLTARTSDLGTNYITGCYQDRKGDFWLISALRGVIWFRPSTMQFKHFPLKPEIRQSIVEGEKQIFVEDRNGTLWVGIYGGGISRFNRETETFQQYLHEENNPASLSSNLVLSLFADNSGNIWAGTYKRGLDKINLIQNHFNNRSNDFNQNVDFQSEIRAVFEDSRRWIWTGNKRGEVVVYNQKLEVLFRLNDILGEQGISTGTYCFEEDQSGNIWVGTKGNGIIVLKGLPKTGNRLQTEPEIVNYAKYSGDNTISHNDVFDLYSDHLGQMWVAMYHGGINVIRNPLKEDQEILRYLRNTDDKFSITDNRVRCFLEDHNHNMWIGTANGLNFLNHEYLQSDNKKFIQIQQTNQPESISYNDIICLFQDSRKTIWIGTYGGGVNQFLGTRDGRNFNFAQTTTADGLSSDLILGFVEDRDQNLWISTDFGLGKFNLISRKIENFYESDGLMENSFSEGKGIFSSGGSVIFGHLSGFVWFQPSQIKKQERQVPVVLTDLQINNQTDKAILRQARQRIEDPRKPIKLKYKQNFITFEFAALDFKAPSKVQYEFKLENYERSWNKTGNLNKAIYRELQPGNYLFRLKASNSDGLWVNPEIQLPITIKSPPWATAWAYLFYILFASGILFLVRRFTLERIRLKHEVEFEKQLADDKLKFYTSISHEFKTPLALILGPVEDLLADKSLPPGVSNPLRMVKRNTRRLLELIEQLMDFRKIQKGFLKNEVTPGNVVYFLSEIVQAFRPLAEKKKIEFQYIPSEDRLDVNLDFKSLEKIIFNLLSNAFKHTGEGQRVELRLDMDKDDQKVEIAVIDEGEGIREQEIPHLFERFTFGKRSRWKDESSTGIGLSLTKELIELMGGEIRVESTFGKGSRFCVVIPYTATETPVNLVQELDYTSQFISTEEEPETETPEATNGKRILKKQTILVVEDNPDLRSWLATQLGQKYTVLQAENGKIGVEIAKNEDPELIICDIMMPEMDGIELTSILKTEFHTSHIPIVLLTAKSLEEHKIEGIETGADDYITKPFNMIYLQKRIENILRQRKKLRERFSRDLLTKTDELSPSTADQEFMDKVIGLIEENLTDQEFSIDNLLPHFNFGRTVFYKKMKGISGYSPKDFVKIIRMKKAGALLSDPSTSVSEVAFEIGFNDANYFSRQFKKHFGENPSDYQKRQKVSSPSE